jgi:hypothetical protein
MGGASEATLKPAFSGTIVSTYPDGRQGKLWLSDDGSYKAAGRKGDKSSGHWKIKGDKVCLSQSRPIPAPFAFCTPVPQSKEWSAKAVSGEPIRVRVVAGGRPG